MIENSFKRLFYKATNGIEPFALLRKRNVSFGFERRRNGADELSALAGSEQYEACDDEGAYRFRRGYRSRNSERMRLTS